MKALNANSPASKQQHVWWTVIAGAGPVSVLVVFAVWHNAAPVHLLMGWIAAVAAGHFALGRLKRAASGARHLRIARAGLAMAYLLPVFVLGFALVLVAPRVRSPGPYSIEASNIRQIGQASLIYANDHRERLPAPTVSTLEGDDRPSTLHDVAFLLAKYGGLNDASYWISVRDHERPDWSRLRTVLNQDQSGPDPHFASLDKLLVDYATGLHMHHPSTTPIAWTRGLREDGTWDPDGVFGVKGGHIVFLGGNVRFYKNLRGEDRLVRADGTRTSNILDTLPPGARVVGLGPATLNGRVSSVSALPDDRLRKEGKETGR